MKINSASDTVVERNGLSSDGAFKIQFSSKMAKILSDGLYSDKIKSIIRELSCNAIDSHVESGQATRPIEVHLPTSLEPWFSVTDFGVGLDHAQVVDIYTTYGASTKTNSNDFIGQLGLGSKSPFSYVDAYDVTAVKHGMKRQYSMYKSENGMPSVALLNEASTTEPNGVVVKMPVRAEDMRNFYDKALAVFCWFPVKPIVKGTKSFEYPKFNRLFNGSTWYLDEKHSYHNFTNGRRAIALMGNVAYPIDPNAITNLSRSQATVAGIPVVINFDIGELEISASRESLGYDDRTKTNIKAKLDVVVKELTAEIEKSLVKCNTKWEAHVEYGKLFERNSHGYRYEFERLFGQTGLKWRNITINTSGIDVKLSEIWDTKTGLAQIWTHGNRKRMTLYSNLYDRLTLDTRRAKIVIDDLPKGSVTRCNHYIDVKGLDSYSEVQLYLIGQSTTGKSQQDILDLLGNPPFVLASTLPPKPSTATKTKKVKMLAFDQKFTKGNRHAWYEDPIQFEDGGIYIKLDVWDIETNNIVNCSSYEDLNNLINSAKHLGMIDKDAKIYAPRGSYKTKIESEPKWKNLFEVMRDSINAKMTPAVIQDIANYRHYNEFMAHIDDDETSLWRNSQKLFSKTSNFAMFSETMRTIEKSISSASAYQGLISVATMFGKNITQPPNIDCKTMWKTIQAQYPMLELLISLPHYSRGSVVKARLSKIIEYINQVDELKEIKSTKISQP